MEKSPRRHRPPQPPKQSRPLKATESIVSDPASKSKTAPKTALKVVDPLAVPQELRTKRQVDGYLAKLFAQANASEINQALVPWLMGDLDSHQSRSDYVKAIRHFAVAMGNQGLHVLAVTSNDVKLYKAARKESGDRPATIAQAMSVIRGMYQQLGEAHLIEWERVSDIQAVKSPKVEKNTTPGLSFDQANALLNAPDLGTLPGLRDHAMLYTFLYTGLRVSAIATARVGGLEQIDGQWSINVTEKRDKERKIELLDATAPVMRWVEAAELTGFPDWPLFPAFEMDRKTIVDRCLSRDTIRKLIKRYGRKVGIQVDGVIQADGQKRRGVGVHSLRKTVATVALKDGANILDVQELLGHASITTTQIYTTNTGDEAKRAQKHLKFG